MSRPLGSKNKPKIKSLSSYALQTNFEKQLENAPMTKNSNRGWINWGSRNQYPLQLSELYYNSIVHKSCVDFAVSAIVGDGVDYEAMKLNASETMPSYQSTWEDFLKAIALDYVLYGSYAFQIIKNKDGKTYSFYHQPISSVRCSPKDEDGVITSYWLCNDWTQTGKYPPIEIPRFGFTEDEKIANGKPYLFVYDSYCPDLEYYSSPKYVGAIKAIKTELELIRYELRSSLNNFASNGMLILPRVESEEERIELLKNIKNSFTGSDNANSLMVCFSNGDDNDSNVAKFVKIESSVDNVNLFADSNNRTIDRVVSAHRIPSKMLIGMPVEGATLGGNSNELAVAFDLYSKTVANENRKAIINTINKMFALNGIDTEIILKPLQFSLLNGNEQKEQVQQTEIVKEEDIQDNTLIEKVTNVE